MNQWKHSDGTPLRFQKGDYVRIDTSSNPARQFSLPFLEGYVRGYDLAGGEAAYELYKMGNSPLRWVREAFLALAPDPYGNHQHLSDTCGICGHRAATALHPPKKITGNQ